MNEPSAHGQALVLLQVRGARARAGALDVCMFRVQEALDDLWVYIECLAVLVGREGAFNDHLVDL